MTRPAKDTLTLPDSVTDAEVTCMASPVQIQGNLADGWVFYFRSRFRHAQLGVGRTLDEAVAATCGVGDGACVTRETHGPEDQYGAGAITLREASALLADLLDEAFPTD